MRSPERFCTMFMPPATGSRSAACNRRTAPGLGARRKVLHSRTIAAELCGVERATIALCEVGVRLMK
eukprot:6437227-Prymnesium_polylepis.1